MSKRNTKTARAVSSKPAATRVPAGTKDTRKNAMAAQELLEDAVIASVDVRAETDALRGKREGAYSLYVKAAIAAGSVEALGMASDRLFAAIRKDGKVKGRDIGAKLNREGTAYVIPSAVSSAKSYLMDALAHKVPLTDAEGAPRAYTAIRGDVMLIKREEKEAAKSSTDKVQEAAKRAADVLKSIAATVAKLDCSGLTLRRRDLIIRLSELADLIGKEENEQDAGDLHDRINDALTNYGYVSPQDEMAEQEAKDDADVLAEAAGIDDDAEEEEEAPAPVVRQRRRPAPRRAAAH